MRQLIVTLLLALAGGVAGYAAAGSDDVVTARKFAVVDANGVERANLGFDETSGTAMLTFITPGSGAASGVTLGLYNGDTGPMVALSDSTGLRLALALNDHGPTVILYDEAGHRASSLTTQVAR